MQYKTMAGQPHPAVDPNKMITGMKPDDVFNAELSAEMVKRTDKLNDNTIELALRIKQAREFMAWSASHLRASWLEWCQESDKALKDITMTRMAIERETKQATAAAKDIRDFFSSREYLEGSARMKEMIELMERFQKLQADGVMDAFAEFILASCK